MSEPVSINAAVAFMHPDDIEKVFVPSSKREPVTIVPEYSRDQDGVDTVKVLMATSHLIVFEASRPKGAVDRMHVHPAHHSIAYQKTGRVRMTIRRRDFHRRGGRQLSAPVGRAASARSAGGLGSH